MARLNRIKVLGEDAYYHVMSRTVGQDFLLKQLEKDKLLCMIKNLSNLFFVKIIGFSIMSNHFHILIKMECDKNFTDEEIITRIQKFSDYKTVINGLSIKKFRDKLSDISEFMKFLKQNFSLWYNKKNNRKGHFWSDRFKSVLVENGESLLNCLAYIDLNPVRAGIINSPEKYKWNSLGFRFRQKKNDSFVSFDGVFDNNIGDLLQKYIEYLEKTGGSSIGNNDNKNYKKSTNMIQTPKIFNKRNNIYSKSMVLGSQTFVQNAYTQFRESFWQKKDKTIYVTDFSNKIFSIQRSYKNKSNNN